VSEKQFSQEDWQPMDARLKDFINRAIVPALVSEYLAQLREVDGDNARIVARCKSAAMSANRVERSPDDSNAMQLLTVVEAAATLGIKERTVRAWILKRKIAYVKLDRLVRIPAKDVRLMIERATIPSRTHLIPY
jgi:excisionase family DNA binding protein